MGTRHVVEAALVPGAGGRLLDIADPQIIIAQVKVGEGTGQCLGVFIAVFLTARQQGNIDAVNIVERPFVSQNVVDGPVMRRSVVFTGFALVVAAVGIARITACNAVVMRIVHPVGKSFHIRNVDYRIDVSHQVEFLVQVVDLRRFERIRHVLVHRLTNQVAVGIARHGQRAHTHDVSHSRGLAAEVSRSHHALHTYPEPVKNLVFKIDASRPAFVFVVHDIPQLVGQA